MISKKKSKKERSIFRGMGRARLFSINLILSIACKNLISFILFEFFFLTRNPKEEEKLKQKQIYKRGTLN